MTWPGHCLPWALQSLLESSDAACGSVKLTISKNFHLLANLHERIRTTVLLLN